LANSPAYFFGISESLSVKGFQVSILGPNYSRDPPKKAVSRFKGWNRYALDCQTEQSCPNQRGNEIGGRFRYVRNCKPQARAPGQMPHNSTRDTQFFAASRVGQLCKMNPLIMGDEQKNPIDEVFHQARQSYLFSLYQRFHIFK